MLDPQSGRARGGEARDGPATLREVIDQQAEDLSDAPFLCLPAGGVVMSYRALRARARAVAGRLAGLGLTKVRTVALVLDNGLTFVDALLGTVYGGAVAVPLSPESGPRHIGHALEHCRADLVIGAPAHADLLATAGVGRRSPPAVLVPADQGLEAWSAEAPADPAATMSHPWVRWECVTSQTTRDFPTPGSPTRATT